VFCPDVTQIPAIWMHAATDFTPEWHDARMA
jgi:hypothetical protein